MKLIHLLILIAAIHTGDLRSAHAIEYSQETQEYFFASQLAQALSVSQDMTNQPLWLTNMQEIVSVMPIQYLAGFETKFLKFGRKAGFTNSLLEKYVLLPRGIKGPHRDYGDIMLVAAAPIKRESGKAGRVFIAKANDRFAAGWVTEDELERSLGAVGLRLSQLPMPPPMPSVRSLYDPDGRLVSQFDEMDAQGPLWARMQAQIAHACQRVGISPWWAPWIQLALLVMLLALFGLFGWFLWRRTLRSSALKSTGIAARRPGL